jgi:glucan phosphoethanolaminetransferase (alkaline phosphatase superfamily)
LYIYTAKTLLRMTNTHAILTKTKAILPFFLLISFIPFSDFLYHVLRHEYLAGVTTFLFVLVMFLLPVFLFRNNVKLYLKLLAPVFLIVPFNMAYVMYFDSKISEATILMIFNTNRAEAYELLKNYFLVLGFFLIIYFGVLYFFYEKVPAHFPPKWAQYISILCLVILALSPIPRYQHNLTYAGNLNRKVVRNFPGTVVDAVQVVWQENKYIAATKKDRDKFKFYSKQDSACADKQVHVLIIGESARYDHWGINGYARNTSPLLSKRKDLITYSNFSSGGFITERAVPLLLTGLRADKYNLHPRRKGIVGAFNEAGFATSWITNQTDAGNIKMHSLEAQKGYYLLTDFRANKNVHRDMELVGILKNVLAEPGNRKFIVIHTQGSHYSYSARYPSQFDIFKPSNKTIEAEITNKRYKNALVNSYDNSIVYTDAVIDSVISLVNGLNYFSSVTYISDHGEDLFDDNRDLTSHNSGLPPSKYDAHIPFFIWYSPKLAAAYPAKIANLIQHKSAPASSENLIYSITSLIGLHYPGQQADKDLTSPAFKNNKQLLMGDNNNIYLYSELK